MDVKTNGDHNVALLSALSTSNQPISLSKLQNDTDISISDEISSLEEPESPAVTYYKVIFNEDMAKIGDSSKQITPIHYQINSNSLNNNNNNNRNTLIALENHFFLLPNEIIVYIFGFLIDDYRDLCKIGNNEWTIDN